MVKSKNNFTPQEFFCNYNKSGLRNSSYIMYEAIHKLLNQDLAQMKPSLL